MILYELLNSKRNHVLLCTRNNILDVFYNLCDVCLNFLYPVFLSLSTTCFNFIITWLRELLINGQENCMGWPIAERSHCFWVYDKLSCIPWIWCRQCCGSSSSMTNAELVRYLEESSWEVEMELMLISKRKEKKGFPCQFRRQQQCSLGLRLLKGHHVATLMVLNVQAFIVRCSVENKLLLLFGEVNCEWCDVLRWQAKQKH